VDRATQLRLTAEILQHRRAGTVPLADAVMENPVAVYHQPDHLAREQEVLFRRYPLVVGHVDQVRNPGDFFTDGLAGTPVVVVRGDGGELGAFHNVCRHRGARVEEAACGNRHRFTCPYHAWSYDRQGKLRAVPDDDGFPGLDREARGLVALPVAERHGLVWVHPTPGAEMDLAAHLGGLDDELSSFGLDGYVLDRTEVLRQPFNWKLVVDGFLEAYHLRFLHRTTIGPYIRSNFTPTETFGSNLRMIAARASFDGELDRPAEDVDFLANVAMIYVLFPNTVLVWQSDHFECWTAFPDRSDPSSTVMRASLFAPERATTADQQLHWDKNWKVLMDTVLNEDFRVARSMQEGFASGAQSHVLFGRNEPALQHYHKELAAVCSPPGSARS
jgi:phenylpropionate dioxygenase-like ring-hydroxylating dioxygenase large terminal subunit